MKTKLIKAVLFVAILTFLVMCFVACNDAKTISVKVMDGETELASLSVAEGGSLDYSGEVAKEGYVLKGLFYDKEFKNPFDKDAAIAEDLILYAQFEKVTYTITVNANGGNAVDPVVVSYGEAFTLAQPEREGYEFLGYTYLDDDEVKQPFNYTTYPFKHNVRVTAQWKDTFTVTLNDTISETPVVLNVNYGGKAILPGAPEKRGYTFAGWFEEDASAAFDANTEIKKDYVLTARFTANSYTISIVNYPSWTQTVAFGDNYTLPTAEAITAAITGEDKEWSEFIGYQCAEVGFDATKTTDVYKWDHNIVVTARCTENVHYNKSTITLYREKDNLSMGSFEVEKGSTIQAQISEIETDRVGYVFDGWFEAEATEAFNMLTPVNSTLTLYARYTAMNYTITLDYGDGVTQAIPVTYDSDYALPETPMKDGYNFVKYQLNGEDFNRIGKYIYTNEGGITVTIIWEQDTTLFVEAATYFKERATTSDPFTYVFLTGRTYDFGDAEISTTDGYSYVSLRSVASTNDRFAATAATEGNTTFTLTVTPKSGVAKTIRARVVESVNTFGAGSNYNGMISTVGETNIFMSTTTAKDYVMDVGNENYIPDVVVTNYNHQAITLSAANMNVTVDGADVTTALSGNALNLSADLRGDSERVITLTPKYALSGDKISAVSFKIRINEGVNVYNNADLKLAYKNVNVQKINILRNIEARLDASDYDLSYGGHGYQLGTVNLYECDNYGKNGAADPVKTIEVDTGTPINDFAHSVYVRSTARKDDNLVINGNYFVIDGSKLPYIDNEHDHYGADGSQYAQDGPYRVANTQLGIFLYRCVEEDASGGINRKFNDGNVTMNNLRIESNYIPEYATYVQLFQDNPQEKPLLKMSAAYIGVVVRGGTMNMDNVSISKAEMGFMLHGEVSGYDVPGVDSYTTEENKNRKQPNEDQACKLNFKNSMIDFSWANSIYAFDLCEMNLSNSKIGRSCGAAISVDDRPYVKDGGNGATNPHGFSDLNTELNIDVPTIQSINNWVTGAEAWFVAYGMGPTATGAITNIEGIAESNNMTIESSLTDTVNDMNFAILVRPVDVNSAAWNEDIGGKPGIDINLVAPDALAVPGVGGIVFTYSNEKEHENATALGDAMTFLKKYDQSQEKFVQYCTDEGKDPTSQAVQLEYATKLQNSYDTATEHFNVSGSFLKGALDTPMGRMILMIPVTFTA